MSAAMRFEQAAPAPEATPAALGGRIGSSATWSVIGFGGAQLIRLVSNLILTRLVTQESLGLMTLVGVLLHGLSLFSDIGIGPSIIQNRRGAEPRFRDTAFTIQAMRGAILWVAACIAAAPFSVFYEDPRLAWVVPLVAITTVAQGLSSTKMFVANRELSLERLMVVEIVSQLVGTVVMLAWALYDPTVVALAVGGIAIAVAKMLLGHLALPGRLDRFGWDRQAARDIFRFGRWIFIGTMVTFFAEQSDRMVFGKLIPRDLLGVYYIALTVATMPWLLLGHIGQSVYFPVYSRAVVRGDDLAAEFHRTRRPIMLLAGWAVSGLLAGGPTAIRLLYPKSYGEAEWIVQFLTIGVWFSVLESLNGAVLLSLGKPKWLTVANFLKFVGILILIPVGHAVGGFPGAVAALIITDVVRYAVSGIGTAAHGLSVFRRDLVLTLLVAAVGSAGWLAVRQIRGQLPMLLEALLIALAVTAIWLPIGWSHLRPFIAQRRGSRARAKRGNPAVTTD
jgi:O-antigen/teichoic acid export membrane protein